MSHIANEEFCMTENCLLCTHVFFNEMCRKVNFSWNRVSGFLVTLSLRILFLNPGGRGPGYNATSSCIPGTTFSEIIWGNIATTKARKKSSACEPCILNYLAAYFQRDCELGAQLLKLKSRNYPLIIIT